MIRSLACRLSRVAVGRPQRALLGTRVHVSVLSDPRCPLCLVAHSRLEKAVAAASKDFGDTIEVTYEWNPYFLDETLPFTGVDRRGYYENKFGVEAMAASESATRRLFEEEGVSTHLDIAPDYSIDGIAANSLPALRLLALAQIRNVPKVVDGTALELFRCYFGAEKPNIASTKVLAKIASKVGLLPEFEARTFLDSDALSASVIHQAEASKAAGLGVPHTTISLRSDGNETVDSVEISGAASVGELTEHLLDLLSKSDGDAVATPVNTGATAAMPVPQATASDKVAAIKFRWNTLDLIPTMLQATGGAWPAEWPLSDEHFSRLDPGNDVEFYADARLDEQHLDEHARNSLRSHYDHLFTVAAAENKSRNGCDGAPVDSALDVLDLCSSFESHFPAPGHGRPELRTFGMGLNAEELAANSLLAPSNGGLGYAVQDLNEDPMLAQHEDESFDLVTMALSVDYLTRPREVFAEAFRVLRPGGRFAVAFSNRMFRSKAVAVWRDADDNTRLWVVAAYAHYSHGGWLPPKVFDLSPSSTTEVPSPDPIWIVHVQKPM